ncbi:MAG: 3'(2'),5'-bisphosphate nucleotidase CysQ [Parvibaculaceae bacterium]
MAEQGEPSAELRALAGLALVAGREILDIYGRDIAVSVKDDLSPVTEADEVAEKVILAGLARLAPGIPVIAEEAAAAGKCPPISSRFYLVDPLDGTKEFIGRNGEFTVNIALVERGIPVAGVVYAPALRRLYIGEVGIGAFEAEAEPDQEALIWKRIATRPRPADGLIVVASRSHRDKETEAFLDTQPVKELVSAGSSLKFCLLACGKADLYPRFGRTMEWDIAAGHAVLAAAGGRVETADGQPMTYGKTARGYDNPAFIAWAN